MNFFALQSFKYCVESRNTCTFQIHFSYHMTYNRRKIGRYFWFSLDIYGITRFFLPIYHIIHCANAADYVLVHSCGGRSPSNHIVQINLAMSLFFFLKLLPKIENYLHLWRVICTNSFFLDSQHLSCWVGEGVKSVKGSTSLWIIMHYYNFCFIIYISNGSIALYWLRYYHRTVEN